jgi:hypothetical protein
MVPIAGEHAAPRPTWVARGRGFAGPFCVLAVSIAAVGFLAAAQAGKSLPFAATAVIVPWVAIAVPFLGEGWGAPVRGLLSALPALALAHVLGAASLPASVASAALLAGAAVGAWGLASLGARSGAGPTVVALLVVAATASPWIVEPALREAGGPQAKMRLASLALSVSPAAAAADLHGVDWLRRGSLYEESSIGPDVPYRYPRWERFALGAALLGVLARLAAGRLRRSSAQERS